MSLFPQDQAGLHGVTPHHSSHSLALAVPGVAVAGGGVSTAGGGVSAAGGGAHAAPADSAAQGGNLTQDKLDFVSKWCSDVNKSLFRVKRKESPPLYRYAVA